MEWVAEIEHIYGVESIIIIKFYHTSFLQYSDLGIYHILVPFYVHFKQCVSIIEKLC